MSRLPSDIFTLILNKKNKNKTWAAQKAEKRAAFPVQILKHRAKTMGASSTNPGNRRPLVAACSELDGDVHFEILCRLRASLVQQNDNQQALSPVLHRGSLGGSYIDHFFFVVLANLGSGRATFDVLGIIQFIECLNCVKQWLF